MFGCQIWHIGGGGNSYVLSDVTVLAAALSRPDYAHCALCCARLAGGNFLPCAGAGTGPGQVLTHSWAGMGRVTTTTTLHPAQPLMYCNNVLHEHMMQKQKHRRILCFPIPRTMPIFIRSKLFFSSLWLFLLQYWMVVSSLTLNAFLTWYNTAMSATTVTPFDKIQSQCIWICVSCRTRVSSSNNRYVQILLRMSYIVSPCNAKLAIFSASSMKTIFISFLLTVGNPACTNNSA